MYSSDRPWRYRMDTVYKHHYPFWHFRYFCEVTLENKERLSSASDLLNVMKSELDNLSTGPDDKTKLEICTNVWEKIKKPEPTAKQEKPTVGTVS